MRINKKPTIVLVLIIVVLVIIVLIIIILVVFVLIIVILILVIIIALLELPLGAISGLITLGLSSSRLIITSWCLILVITVVGYEPVTLVLHLVVAVLLLHSAAFLELAVLILVLVGLELRSALLRDFVVATVLLLIRNFLLL
jgi:hypothetical protein